MHTAIRTVSKFNLILCIAALVTGALFYSMQLLIMLDETQPGKIQAKIFPEITLPEIELTILRQTPKPEEITEPPPLPEDILIDRLLAVPLVISIQSVPDQLPDISDDFGHLGPANGNAMPIAQIQPVYPTRAQERGIEGFVIMEFDVSETGTVINPRVLVSSPEGVFDRAAMRAIERWKYNPMMVNGKAVTMRGLQTKFSFSLRE